MKNIILAICTSILLVVYINQGSNTDTSFFYPEVSVKNVKNGSIQNIDIEDYVIGVVAGEMPASFEMEALKAQAVAARTYAYYKINNSTGNYDLTNDTSSQVYLNEIQMQEKWQDDYEKYYTIIKNAVNLTKDEVIVYNNEIISAYYFSMSNGYTEDAKTVFNETKPYLLSVSSEEEKDLDNNEVVIQIDKDLFCKKLNITCSNILIKDIIRNDTNHIETIVINDKKFTGIEIRKLLSLRSTDFEFEIINQIVDIKTHGYGHGVGMSQYGANIMAKRGASYADILKHYYSNVEIVNINSIN